jgi:2-polyprenyl-3-methyl-5-hydroxy-6-metoxy-1,4-benzoquinol methylase
MDNGKTQEVIHQFDKIAQLPDYWDHNQQYQPYLLSQIDEPKEYGLDIGCGTGELTDKLVKYCKHVVGIDISTRMIEEAKKRHNKDNIEFITNDIDKYFSSTQRTFDVVISIATFHHLDMEKVLKSINSKLNKGGILLILDLYKQHSLYEQILSVVATICNPIMYLIKRRSLFNTEEERNAWEDHFKYDKYTTIEEIREIAKKELGQISIKRHLFWRYSLVYRKE